MIDAITDLCKVLGPYIRDIPRWEWWIRRWEQRWEYLTERDKHINEDIRGHDYRIHCLEQVMERLDELEKQRENRRLEAQSEY